MSGVLLAGGAVVLLLFFGGFTLLNRLLFGFARGGGIGLTSPSGRDAWLALGMLMTFGVASLVNLVLLAENRLSSPVENKSTALRIGFFVQFLVIVGGFTAVSHFATARGTPGGAVMPLAVLGLAHLAIVAVFTVTEDFAVSRRVFRRIETPSRLSLLWAILWP